LLHKAPPGSVTIVVTGAQKAVHRLLQSGANHAGDGIDLTGGQLIESRVRELVCMGGDFSGSGRAEYNIRLDVEAARVVAPGLTDTGCL
jgi:hypothetical protein